MEATPSELPALAVGSRAIKPRILNLNPYKHTKERTKGLIVADWLKRPGLPGRPQPNTATLNLKRKNRSWE
jgi:hypothetical protein